jgi:acetyl-CoA carboxylase biotin carboxylase subunit
VSPALPSSDACFVANRGEIAVRIIRACKDMGMRTVLGVSDADRSSLAASLADRVICVGPASSSLSYLNAPALIAAALGTGCTYVHPGYGFLSENADFAEECVTAGLRFVGPRAAAIRAMGDKLNARRVAAECKVPVVPGSNDVSGPEDILRFAHVNGYPVLVKASAGGGGRGMRVVRNDAQATDAFSSASAEAASAFGDKTLYIEKYIENARHVEVQVLADTHGNVVALGERDCSTQRRHQKLVEEAPCEVLTATQRQQICSDAERLARHVDYVGAGTVEFILDVDTGKLYFLEMNTRIQVEHPVTEMVTGVDLVQQQLRCAAGERLSAGLKNIAAKGHAIECRINAEDPDAGFRPSPGRITRWEPPTGAGVRLDSHCFAGYLVPPYYDSLLGKLIVHGPDRRVAIETLMHCLRQFVVEGVKTTIPLHLALLATDEFRDWKVTTSWLEKTFLSHRAEPAAHATH